MIALVTGFFLVAYLLATGAIYRLAFGFYLPSKRFQRTRTEEVMFSVLVTLTPFVLAWALLLHTPLGRFPAFSGPQARSTKADAYRILTDALVADTPRNAADTTSASYLRAFKEQARFILWLWALCFLEGALAARFVSGYGDYPDGSFKKALCENFLLKHVSEWQVLFTTLPLKSTDPRQVVEIDALSNAGVLYRGRLDNWFTDLDGKLAGIFLTNAERYQRDRANRDKAGNMAQPSESYWTAVPGSKLYLTASSLTNYNIRYVEPSVEDIAAQELGEGVIVIPLPGEIEGQETAYEPRPEAS